MSPDSVDSMQLSAVTAELMKVAPSVVVGMRKVQPDVRLRMARDVLRLILTYQQLADPNATTVPDWVPEVQRLMEAGHAALVEPSRITGQPTVSNGDDREQIWEERFAEQRKRIESLAERGAELEHQAHVAGEAARVMRETHDQHVAELQSQHEAALSTAHFETQKATDEAERQAGLVLSLRSDQELLNKQGHNRERELQARVDALERELRMTPRVDDQVLKAKQQADEMMIRMVSFVERKDPELGEQLRDGLANRQLREFESRVPVSLDTTPPEPPPLPPSLLPGGSAE